MVETMKLFTVQSLEAWTIAQASGSFQLQTWDHICDEWFEEAYRWMILQMKMRVGKPYSACALPLWAWQFRDKKQSQILKDLKRGGHLSEGKKGIYIEFEIEADKVLLSEFVAWHAVLNNCYAPLSDDEYEQHEKWRADNHLAGDEHDNHPLVVAAIRKSWESVFNLEESKAFYESESVQACMWELPLKNVTKTLEFTAKKTGTFLERVLSWAHL